MTFSDPLLLKIMTPPMNKLRETLHHLPQRSRRPRQDGLTMVMDKGLPLNVVEGLLDLAGEHIDFVKLGFGTAVVSNRLKEKIALYRSANINVYFGGTLFEAFIIRDQFEDYMRMLDEYKMEWVEVSDGSLEMPHDAKCGFIRTLSENYNVLSEIGSKDAQIIIPPYRWIELMKKELRAGSRYLIAEARESGTVGIFRSTGEVRSGLIQEILTRIPNEKILWEAPQKSQQVWFLKMMGANVNLGNIAPGDVVALEAMRLGLRADTFAMPLKDLPLQYKVLMV